MRFLLPLLVLLSLPSAACSQAQQDARTAPPADAPHRGGTASGPSGLFYTQMYWIATRHLEEAAWYFAPDGQVYAGLETGLSARDLAAHEGRRGTYAATGDVLRVTWADGATVERAMEDVSAEGFTWDMRLFAAVPPLSGDRPIAGTYTGGSSLSLGGTTTHVSTTLELRADGTYTRHGAAAASSDDYDAGGTGAVHGTWHVEGYTLTLSEDGGETRGLLAFPWDDEETPAYPDRLFVGGEMYTRQ